MSDEVVEEQAPVVLFPVVAPGETVWVDALCVCGNTDSHRGTFCPQRPDPAGAPSEE